MARVSRTFEECLVFFFSCGATDNTRSIVIQFEDFKNPFPALERYRDVYTCFNDDVQGTGAVIAAGFINAVKMSKIPPKHQRAIFLGAGSAGVGVAKQLVEFFIKEGLTEDEARRRFYFVDSNVSAPISPDPLTPPLSLFFFFFWVWS